MCALTGAANAGAAPITVGSPLSTVFTQENFGQLLTVINSAVGETGSHATSPVNGTIVSWNIEGTGGPFFLQVLTPLGGNSYRGGPVSGPGVPASVAPQSFSTNMPIKAGQIVGLDNSNTTDQIGVAAFPGSAFAVFSPQVANGSNGTTAGSVAGEELAFNAIVQPLPKITGLHPRSETRKGGKKVTIRGKNFDGTTAVMFGNKKAKKFKVISDTKIVAVPRAHHAGTVHVTVRNPGKSPASAASKFKFTRTT